MERNTGLIGRDRNTTCTILQDFFSEYYRYATIGINNTVDSTNITSLDKQFITKVLKYINDNLSDENLNVENLAGELLLSRSKLYRKINWRQYKNFYRPQEVNIVF